MGWTSPFPFKGLLEENRNRGVTIMNRIHKFPELLIIVGVIMTSCTSKVPDVVYLNGNIWTGAENPSRVQALAVAGGTILATGSDEKVRALAGAGTRTVNLEGKFVVPGFIDTHTHLMSGGIQLVSVDLRDADDPREFVERIRQFVRKQEPGKWVLEGNWDHERWGGALPDRSWIDSVTVDNPVFISRLDGHMGLANTKALELAGISSDTPSPPGGLILKNPDSGEPTGILKDEAMSLVYQAIPELSEKEKDQAFQRAVDFIVSQGVTEIHDMCSWDNLQTYIRNYQTGRFKIRIRAHIWYTNWEQLSRYISEHGRGDSWLWWGGIKAMIDGSLGSRTAWMYEPYLDDPSTVGLIVSADTIEFKEALRGADKAGIQIATHAIGDHANDWVLDLYRHIEKENGVRDRRFRIEHAQHPTGEGIDRFASQKIIASMQPYHIIDDGRWAGKRLKPEALQTSYALKSLVDAGATVCLGSDWTVAPISPIDGIYAAVTRRTLDGKNPDGWYPDERITVEQALKAYTMGGAFATFQENELGTLEEGKLADFVVLSQDLFQVDVGEIRDVKVLRTVVGGNEQFVSQQ